MMKTEKNVIKLYQKFPSQRNRVLLCFFEAEIRNNFLKSYNFSSDHNHQNDRHLNGINDKNFQKMKFDNIDVKNNYLLKQMNLFDNNHIISMQISYGSRKGELISFSDKAPSFFGYDKQSFTYLKHINDLIPKTISRTHEEFLLNFLITSESKYYKDINLSFIQSKNGYIVPVDFTFDINFHLKNDFAFIAFMKKKEVTPNQSFIILDSNGLIEGITSEFQQQLLLHNENENEVLDSIYTINFTQMLPDFPDMIKEMNTRKESVRHFDKQIMNSKSLVDSQAKKNKSITSIADGDMDKSTVTEKQSVLQKSLKSNLSVLQSIKSAKQLKASVFGISAKRVTNHIGKMSRVNTLFITLCIQ